MTKLTKTEQALLDCVSKRNTIVVTRMYGRGSKGGCVTAGQRELTAAISLVKKGLIEHVKTDKATIPNSGYTTWVSDHVFKVL